MVCAATVNSSPALLRCAETAACRGKATILREGWGDPPSPPGSAPTRTRHAQPRETGRAGEDAGGLSAGGRRAVTRCGVFHHLASIHRSRTRSLQAAGARYARCYGPPPFRGTMGIVTSGWVQHRRAHLVGVSRGGSNDMTVGAHPHAHLDISVTVPPYHSFVVCRYISDLVPHVYSYEIYF